MPLSAARRAVPAVSLTLLALSGCGSQEDAGPSAGFTAACEDLLTRDWAALETVAIEDEDRTADRSMEYLSYQMTRRTWLDVGGFSGFVNAMDALAGAWEGCVEVVEGYPEVGGDSYVLAGEKVLDVFRAAYPEDLATTGDKLTWATTDGRPVPKSSVE